MAAAVQVSVNHALKTDGKCSARMAAIHDIERNCQAPICQVIGIAQRNYFAHEITFYQTTSNSVSNFKCSARKLNAQAFSSSH
jgi:hypothetical protein